MTSTPFGTEIDVRAVALGARHPLVFSTFRDLEIGAALEVLNDHDPKPLHLLLRTAMGSGFSWDYLQSGPDVFRVRIRKLPAARGDDLRSLLCPDAK